MSLTPGWCGGRGRPERQLKNEKTNIKYQGFKVVVVVVVMYKYNLSYLDQSLSSVEARVAAEPRGPRFGVELKKKKKD